MLANVDLGNGARIRWWIGEEGARGLRGSCRAFRSWLLAVEATMPWYASPERRRGVEAALDAWCREEHERSRARLAARGPGPDGIRLQPILQPAVRASPDLTRILLATRNHGALCRVGPDGAIERAPPQDERGPIDDACIDDEGNVAFTYASDDDGALRVGWWGAGSAPARRPDAAPPPAAGPPDSVAIPVWRAGNAGRIHLARLSPRLGRLRATTIDASDGRATVAELPLERTGDPRDHLAAASRDGRTLLVAAGRPPFDELIVLDLEGRRVRSRARLARPPEARASVATMLSLDGGWWFVASGRCDGGRVRPAMERAYLVHPDGRVSDLTERAAAVGLRDASAVYAGPNRILALDSTVYRVDDRVGIEPVARLPGAVSPPAPFAGPDGRALDCVRGSAGGAAPALAFRTVFVPR